MQTELYKGREWPAHVRTFYSEWLDATGWRVDSKRDFDRFVARMEKMIGDYLTDSTLYHVELTPKEDA